jgi:hypothetical protein
VDTLLPPNPACNQRLASKRKRKAMMHRRIQSRPQKRRSVEGNINDIVTIIGSA